MVNRMRHTRAHTANRRSHHGLDKQGVSLCKECGHPKRPHTICPNCGTYKGKKMIDVNKAGTKKAKKTKAK
jgi:large subunit ribosomal protein L32